MTVFKLHEVNGCSECDKQGEQMPLHWDNGGPAPVVMEECSELQCKEYPQQEAIQR